MTRGRRQDRCSRLPQVSAQRTARPSQEQKPACTAPRLSLWIRPPGYYAAPPGYVLAPPPAYAPPPPRVVVRQTPHRERGPRAAAATVGRPPAREPRKEFEALFLDAGRRTKLESFGGCARDVAVGHGRRETRHETIGRSRGTKVARAPREVARVRPPAPRVIVRGSTGQPSRWSAGEDALLKQLVNENGIGKWELICRRLGTNRHPQDVERRWRESFAAAAPRSAPRRKQTTAISASS